MQINEISPAASSGASAFTPSAIRAGTVFEAFARTVASHPSSAFLHIPASATRGYAQGPLDFTYEQAASEVRRVRAMYEAANLRGRRVALLLENRPVFFFHWLALNSLGVSIVPISPDHRVAELTHLLAHSEVVLVVVLNSHIERVSAAAASIDGLQVIELEALESGRCAIADASASSKDRQEDECALLYTSGTTGKPKGCMLGNSYFLAHGQRYLDRRGYVQLEPGRSRVLTPLPLSHINALASSTMGMIVSAGCIIQLDRFHPRSFWADVVSSGATGLHCLGVMPAILLALPVDPNETAHRVRYATAANLDPLHHAEFEKRFGFPLIEGWSMTETGAGAAISADIEPRHVGTRCFGRESDQLEVRIVDERGELVEAGEAGEMLVRRRGDDPRRGFFSGYFKDEAATRAAWSNDWWHTGDVVRRGPDGHLHFVDRIKNLIRRSGENISAVEVEHTMLGHRGVGGVAVTPVNDELRGEEVLAFVVLEPGIPSTQETAQSIFQWTSKEIAYFKAPGWIVFIDQLPTTATHKLERGTLRHLAQTLVGSGECFDMRALKKRSDNG